MLLDNNAGINMCNCCGNNALMSACMSGNLDLLSYLICRGLKLNDTIIFDCFQRLIQSNSLNNVAIIKIILLHIQNVDYNELNISFLHLACIEMVISRWSAYS